MDGQLFRVEASASLGDVFRLTKVTERFETFSMFRLLLVQAAHISLPKGKEVLYSVRLLWMKS